MPEHWLKASTPMFLRRFGEDVVIIDKKDAAPRTVRAIVDRLQPGIGRDGKKLEAKCSLEFANDPVAGIDSSTVDFGAVRVRMAIRLGGPVEDWPLAIAPDADGYQDPGMISLVIK